MDFPPLDDTRWDLLLGAVTGQRPTVADPDSPLATSFPQVPPHDESSVDEPQTWRQTIVRDTYA